MAEKKPRTEAQRAADARYKAKNPNYSRSITFHFGADETAEIEKEIANVIALGVVPSKAEFLREAIRYFDTLTCNRALCPRCGAVVAWNDNKGLCPKCGADAFKGENDD